MSAGPGIKGAHRLRNHVDDPALRRQLDRIFEESLEIWSAQHLREFTIHDAPHYLQVEKNLDALTAYLQTTPLKLSQEEIFVLLAACHLHDIGMQLGVPDARARHAEYAYELILHSSAWIGPEMRRVTLSISDTNAREAIAQIARGHWTNFTLKLSKSDKIYGNEDGRLRLLGLLLANADLLDTSAVRAGYFRASHRLYELEPLSELHQKMHALVKGFDIERCNPDLQYELTYKLTWRDRSETVRLMTEWQLRWFSSQMRQIAPMLKQESGGTVAWSDPWAHVFFRQPIGPIEELSPRARAILVEDVMAQRRIDRDALVMRFHKAMTGKGGAILALDGGEQSDWRYVSDWCDAHARTESEVKVARLDTGSGDPSDLASLIAVVLKQWGRDLASVDQESAIEALRETVKLAGRLVLIVLQEEAQPALRELLKVLVNIVQPDGPARVIILINSEYEHLDVGPVPIEVFDLRSLEETDLDQYLAERYGYSTTSRDDLITAIKTLGLLWQPAKVYQYIELHCDRRAWSSREE